MDKRMGCAHLASPRDAVWLCGCDHRRVSAHRCAKLDRASNPQGHATRRYSWPVACRAHRFVILILLTIGAGGGGRLLVFLTCAAGIAPALLKSKNKRNYFFIVLLLGLSIANVLTHTYSEEDAELSALGIRIALAIIIMMIVIIGGRVIPFFTERPLGLSIPRKPPLEKAALLTSIIALGADAAELSSIAAGVACLAAGFVNGWRLSGWQSLRTVKTPLLWVLHLGYGWIVVGFVIKGLELLGVDVPAIAATHAFTAGGIGVLTLGMMARVSLGHSGRPLAVGKAMMMVFAAINLAAFCRVFGIWLFPSLTMRFLEASSALWLIAFAIYVVVYAPILLRPRLDGKDG
mgnify:CR=1 FL=1